MDKKPAGIHPNRVLQPPLREGAPHSVYQPCIYSSCRHWHFICTCRRSSRHWRTHTQLLWRTFPQMVGAGITKKLQPGQMGSIGLALSHWNLLLKILSQPSPCLQVPLFDRYCPLFHCKKDGSTRSLTLWFLHSCPWTCWSSSSNTKWTSSFPDTSVAPPVAVLCLSSLNHGGRSIGMPQSASTLHDSWISCASCESWLKSEWENGLIPPLIQDKLLPWKLHSSIGKS